MDRAGCRGGGDETGRGRGGGARAPIGSQGFLQFQKEKLQQVSVANRKERGRARARTVG